MPTSWLFPSSYYFVPQTQYRFGIADNYSAADASIPPIDSWCPAAAAAAETTDFDFESEYLKQFGDFVYIRADASSRQYGDERRECQSWTLGSDRCIERCYQDWLSSFAEDSEVEQ